MPNTLQFLRELEKSFPHIINEIEVEDNKIQLLDSQIEMLKNLFFIWAGNKDEKHIFDLIKDVLKEPTIKNGKIYEALVYAWLEYHHIQYDMQVPIAKEECFKSSKNGYDSDGRIIEGNIVFEIKRFGITLPHIEILRSKIQSKLPKDYYLTIGGGKNISTKDLQKKYLEKAGQLADCILQPENCIHMDYIYKDKPSGLEFRAYKCNSDRMASFTISEFDMYEWAENNEFYFMYDASQFCRNVPFILFCPYDKHLAPLFSNWGNDIAFMAFRALCRRIFMHLSKMNERKINEFDGKAQPDILVSTASRKISAIVFMDVSDNYDHNHSSIFVFQNPNADHKIPGYQIDSLFRNNGAIIETFQFDNY